MRAQWKPAGIVSHAYTVTFRTGRALAAAARGLDRLGSARGLPVTWMVLLLVPFLLVPGIVLCVLGLVGRQTFTEPRCVRCKYDLRKTRFEDEEAKACPECGSDLSRPRAVRFGRRQRRLRFLAAGAVLLLLLPVAGVLLVRLQSFGGARGAARSKSNAALIAGLPAGAQEPWDWHELERRLRAGRLSAAEVDQAIAQVTAYLNQQRTAGKTVRHLHWARGFVELAITSGDVSPGRFQKLCRAIFGSAPELENVHRAVRRGRPIQFRLQIDDPLSLHNLNLVYALRQVTVDDREVQVVRRHGDEAVVHPDELSGGRHDGPEGVALKLDLPPGTYEVRFHTDMGVLPPNAALVGLGGKPGQTPRWQNPLCTWQGTCSATVRITAEDESPITLITDAALDPGGAGGLTVSRAYTVPLHEGVRIVAVVDGTDAPLVPYCFRTRVRVNGAEHVSRNTFGHAKNWSLSSNEPRIDLPSPLPAHVERITVILEPAPESAERFPRLESIWGRSIVFEDVPLERHDLDAAAP